MSDHFTTLRGKELKIDRQTDGPSLSQSRRSKKTHSQVALIVRLSCEQEVKDIYLVPQFFSLKMVSE